MIYGLVSSFKAEKKKANVGFEFCLSLSLSLSFSLSQSWGSSPQGHLSYFDLTSLTRNLCFIVFFSLDQINWVFFLFYRSHRLSDKITFNYFDFWIFGQISLTFCYELILRAEAPFSILKKVSEPITSGKCSRRC